ncbi:MAG: hypothetical protein KGJ64_12750, partial [Betaproteobacteria bacterium]|nr:hypothetical protein [Betaproteobacteria bacterium]
VEQDDPRSLADAIRWAWEHREQLPEIGERGRALYRQRYGRDTIVAGLQDALRRALSRSARRGALEDHP